MLDAALQHLRSGRVVAIATETYFGLLVDARRASALDALFELKGRDAARAVALMVPSLGHWRALVSDCPALAERFAQAFWPGPLTLVLPARRELDPRLVIDGHVGVRIAGPSPAAQLVEAFDGPVTATSANLAGEPPCSDAQAVCDVFQAALEQGVLHVVPGHAPGGAVSSLVRVQTEQYAVLRHGAVSQAQLDRVAAQLP